MYPIQTSYVKEVDLAFMIVIGISLAIVVAITIAMIYFVIRYEKTRNPVPTNIPGSTFLEITWIVIPTLIALGFFWIGYIGFLNLRTLPKNALKINVIARMWTWSYKYPNNKRSKELYVPINKPVILLITSKDVVHSFYIPALRVKEDAVPGKETYLWFKADKTGTHTIYCAEYCGELHSAMLSKLHVLPEDEFKEWYNSSEEKQSLSSVEKGAILYKQQGCNACHSITDDTRLTGPSLKNLYGRKVIVLIKGKEVQLVTDEDYIRRSLTEPNSEIVKGFEAIMPSYEGTLSPEEINAIIEYLKSNPEVISQHTHNPEKVQNAKK